MVLVPQTGVVVWLTGLSASGKSTIAEAVAVELARKQIPAVILDGDAIRTTLSSDLGYSKEDRHENVRRVGSVAELLSSQGLVTIVAMISPYRAARDRVRARVSHFVEVFVNAPLGVCEQRDPKGYYRRARSGDVQSFTGVSDDYEPPLAPEVECRTDRERLDTCVQKVVRAIDLRIKSAWTQAS